MNKNVPKKSNCDNQRQRDEFMKRYRQALKERPEVSDEEFLAETEVSDEEYKRGFGLIISGLKRKDNVE